MTDQERCDGAMPTGAVFPPPLPVATEPILQFFHYSHLPIPLQGISKPFGDLAQKIVDALPRNPERTVALRKLLEAKDAAVRASIFKGGA